MSRSFASGGGVPAQQYATGRYYGPPGARAAATRPNGFLGFVPFRVERAHTFTGMAIEVTSAANAGAVVRLGIYADDNGAPGALYADAGTVAVDTTGLKSITGLTLALTPGVWWLAANVQNAATTVPTMRCVNSGVVPGAPIHSSGNQLNIAVGYSAVLSNQTTLPNPLGSLSTTDTSAGVALLA